LIGFFNTAAREKHMLEGEQVKKRFLWITDHAPFGTQDEMICRYLADLLEAEKAGDISRQEAREIISSTLGKTGHKATTCCLEALANLCSEAF
jgi:hypothetical protein